MALFRKRENATPPPTPPVVVTAHDLERASEVFPEYLRALGNDLRIRAAALAIARAGGAPASIEIAMNNQLARGDSGLERPWLWTRSVIREAFQQGDQLLIAYIGLFMNSWEEIEVAAQLADFIDMMLNPAPVEIKGEIYSVVLTALGSENPEAPVIELSMGSFRVRHVLALCAKRAAVLGDAVTPEAQAIARRHL